MEEKRKRERIKKLKRQPVMYTPHTVVIKKKGKKRKERERKKESSYLTFIIGV